MCVYIIYIYIYTYIYIYIYILQAARRGPELGRNTRSAPTAEKAGGNRIGSVRFGSLPDFSKNHRFGSVRFGNSLFQAVVGVPS